jgi:hypothetical protein
MLKRFLTTVLFLGFAIFAMGQTPDTVATKAKTDTVVKKVDTVKRSSFAPKIKKEPVYHPDRFIKLQCSRDHSLHRY